jgi:hypothetical protein
MAFSSYCKGHICLPEQEIHCLCFIASQSMEPRNGSKTNFEAMEL